MGSWWVAKTSHKLTKAVAEGRAYGYAFGLCVKRRPSVRLLRFNLTNPEAQEILVESPCTLTRKDQLDLAPVAFSIDLFGESFSEFFCVHNNLGKYFAHALLRYRLAPIEALFVSHQ